MKLIATVAGAAALALTAAPAAHAGVVAEAKLGSRLDDLVVGADGGAWVSIDRPGVNAIGRAQPDGRFRTAATSEFTLGGVVGPDGNAWFQVGGGRFLRADANDALVTIGDDTTGDPAFAGGPDGTVWSPRAEGDGFWHLAPDGRQTFTLAELPLPCAGADPEYLHMAQASDGAMWMTDSGCHRLVRVGPAGTTTIALNFDPEDLAADASGGVWVSPDLDAEVVAHVDAGGHVATFALPEGVDFTDGVAVAPDGSGWFTLDRCEFLRVTTAGTISFEPAPIHVSGLGFDPAGASGS